MALPKDRPRDQGVATESSGQVLLGPGDGTFTNRRKAHGSSHIRAVADRNIHRVYLSSNLPKHPSKLPPTASPSSPNSSSNPVTGPANMAVPCFSYLDS
jgi:hypothetical protein